MTGTCLYCWAPIPTTTPEGKPWRSKKYCCPEHATAFNRPAINFAKPPGRTLRRGPL